MYISAVLGILAGFGIVVGAIITGTDSYSTFLHFDGLLIVVGGSLANAFMSYPAPQVSKALMAIIEMVHKPKHGAEDLRSQVEQMVGLAFLVRSKGLPGIENFENDLGHDPLMHYGLKLVATDYKSKEVVEMMSTAIEINHQRNILPVTILRNMASTAPAFGMVGTLVGMVIMLSNIQGDISKIGGGLSIALLATLYGVLSARLVFLPAAEKLLFKQELLRFRHYLVAEGLGMLTERKGPRYIQDKLNSYLDPSLHYDLDKDVDKLNKNYGAAR